MSSLSSSGEIVLFEPFESISGIVIVDHAADLRGVIPEVAEPPRVVVRFCVVGVSLVAEVGGQQSEALADVLGVGMHEGVRSNDSELHGASVTANPAAGKAMALRVDCSLLMM